MNKAIVAVGALRVVLLHAKEGEAREHSERRAERAEDTAPEPRDEAIQDEQRHEERPDEPRVVEVRLLVLPDGAGQESIPLSPTASTARAPGRREDSIGAVHDPLSRRKDSEPEPANQHTNGVEEASDGASHQACGQERNQEVVLHALARARLVRLDATVPAAVARREDPSDEVMERAEGADPPAEHSSEDQREREQTERPEQAAIDGMRRQQRHDSDERVGEEESLDGQRETTRASAEVKVPRNAVWTRKYRNSVRNAACEARRAHTRKRGLGRVIARPPRA